MLYAYIDESGQRGHPERASRHFVLSAITYRSASVTKATDLLADLRAKTGRQPGHVLSFKNLSDPHRATVSTMIGNADWMKIIAVVVCKDHLPDTLPNDEYRYLYTFRMLLERISWLAADYSEIADYTLAHIRRLRLANLREYENKLRDPFRATTISWPNLNPKGGSINQPAVLEQLQLADLVASAIGIAFNPPPNGSDAQPAYLQAMGERLWRKNKKLTSYGLKMHPWDDTTRAAYPWIAAL